MYLTAIQALAKALAAIDGKLDAFLLEEIGAVDASDPTYTGHFDGYIADARAILETLEAEGFQLTRIEQ